MQRFGGGGVDLRSMSWTVWRVLESLERNWSIFSRRGSEILGVPPEIWAGFDGFEGEEAELAGGEVGGEIEGSGDAYSWLRAFKPEVQSDPPPKSEPDSAPSLKLSGGEERCRSRVSMRWRSLSLSSRARSCISSTFSLSFPVVPWRVAGTAVGVGGTVGRVVGAAPFLLLGVVPVPVLVVGGGVRSRNVFAFWVNSLSIWIPSI